MKALEKRTVIRINGTVLATLKEAYECLQELNKDLDQLADENADYDFMHDLSTSAEAYLSDFFDAYKDYVKEDS